MDNMTNEKIENEVTNLNKKNNKKILIIIIISILVSLIVISFAIFGKYLYYYSNEFLSMTAENKLKTILIKNGDISYSNGKHYSINSEEYNGENGSTLIFNIYYYEYENDLAISCIVAINDFVVNVAIFLDDYYNQDLVYFMNQKEQCAGSAYIVPSNFNINSTINFTEYTGTSSLKSYYKNLVSNALKSIIIDSNKLLKKYNFNLKEFNYVNFS